MSTKSGVLELLEKNKGESVSGEFIASKLNISRNAVWKAVNDLRKSGYVIGAVTNKGYILAHDSDIISVEAIKSLLVKTDFYYNVEVLDSLPSTNTYAKDLANKNAPHGTVIIAKTQTSGRGRFGRSFHSPPDTGLYMSIILKPEQLHFGNPTFVTAYSAVEVCRAIESIYNKSPSIKWVNDLFLNKKKICGILTEAASDFETRQVQWIVLGIGINVSDGGLTDDMKKIAGSLVSSAESMRKNQLAAEIIKNVLSGVKTSKKSEILSEYRNRLLALGQQITVHKGASRFTATALDIDDNAGLLIKKENGEKEVLFSGEVSINFNPALK